MNDRIILANNETIAIEEGGNINSMVSICENEEAAVAICDLIIPANLTHVTFVADPENYVYAEYDNLLPAYTPTRENESNGEGFTGRVIVRFGFREKTAIELRLDELEETQAIQDGAIEELAEIIAEG